MQESYEINLHVSGKAYTEDSASLSSALVVLKGYEESYSHCLRIAARKFTTEKDHFPLPRIGLVESKTGSLDVTTALDIAAIAAPLAPQVPAMVQYSLDLYKNAGDLIGIATSFFNKTNEPVTITIDNSPGAVVIPIINIGNGTIKISDPAILEAAKLLHPGLNSMAGQITTNQVDTISVSATIPGTDNEITALSMSEKNQSAYKVRSKITVSDTLQKIKCSIYSFNKRSGKGSLDSLEDSASKYYPFEIQDIDETELIDALFAVYSKVSVTKEMRINALGEEVIKKIYIHAIENIYDEPDVTDQEEQT